MSLGLAPASPSSIQTQFTTTTTSLSSSPSALAVNNSIAPSKDSAVEVQLPSLVSTDIEVPKINNTTIPSPIPLSEYSPKANLEGLPSIVVSPIISQPLNPSNAPSSTSNMPPSALPTPLLNTSQHSSSFDYLKSVQIENMEKNIQHPAELYRSDCDKDTSCIPAISTPSLSATAEKRSYHNAFNLGMASSPVSNCSNSETPQPGLQQQSSTKSRRRLPPETVSALEEAFRLYHESPPLMVVSELSAAHRLDMGKIKIWINNRKAKERRIRSREGAMGSPTGCSNGGSSGYDFSDTDSGVRRPRGRASSQLGVPLVSNMDFSSSACTRILKTRDNEQFNIDEDPVKFTSGMFYAMRDRIFQLERHIAKMNASAAAMVAAAAAAAVVDSDTETKRIKERAAVMQSISSRIIQNLRNQAREQRLLSLDDVAEVHVQETMSAEDFVEFFDQKGGIPSVLAGQKSNTGETVGAIISVDFNPKAVDILFGSTAISRIMMLANVGNKDTPVPCRVQTVTVLYNRAADSVSLTFRLTISGVE